MPDAYNLIPRVDIYFGKVEFLIEYVESNVSKHLGNDIWPLPAYIANVLAT